MTERRTSVTQMAELNKQVYDQNQKIKQIQKTAQETNQVTINVQQQLNRQRGVIQNNIDINKQVTNQIKKADKKTNEMRRRQLCIKLLLWIVAILLFALNIALIIWKATTVK